MWPGRRPLTSDQVCHSTSSESTIPKRTLLTKRINRKDKPTGKKESNQCHREVQKEAEINADNVVLLVRERNLKWQLLERIKLNLCPVYII